MQYIQDGERQAADIYRYRCLAGMLLAFPSGRCRWPSSTPADPMRAYWLTAARAMESAARSLDVRLEVIYAERQHPLHDRDRSPDHRSGRRSERPDYVVFSNDYATGSGTAAPLRCSRHPVLHGLSGISPKQRIASRPGARANAGKRWLGLARAPCRRVRLPHCQGIDRPRAPCRCSRCGRQAASGGDWWRPFDPEFVASRVKACARRSPRRGT